MLNSAMLHLPEIGQFALILAFIMAVLQVIVPLFGVNRGQLWLMGYARPLAVGQALFLVISLVLLATSFVMDDFSVAYVAANSNSLLPTPYKIVLSGGLTRARCCCGSLCWASGAWPLLYSAAHCHWIWLRVCCRSWVWYRWVLSCSPWNFKPVLLVFCQAAQAC